MLVITTTHNLALIMLQELLGKPELILKPLHSQHSIDTEQSEERQVKKPFWENLCMSSKHPP
jgi:hypothetical protein